MRAMSEAGEPGEGGWLQGNRYPMIWTAPSASATTRETTVNLSSAEEVRLSHVEPRVHLFNAQINAPTPTPQVIAISEVGSV